MQYQDLLSAVGEYWWHILIAVLTFAVMLLASAHVVLYKRDSRSAIGWVGIIALVPLLGTVLYIMFGINRIRRRARTLRGDEEADDFASRLAPGPEQLLLKSLGERAEHLLPLEAAVTRVTGRPLVAGNQISPLHGGDEAYPQMLNAIEQARSTVTLCTYIFNNDKAGAAFVVALADAVKRGVEVRVLVDAIGARYTWPTILGPLKKAGVPVARFLPRLLPGWFAYANLRSHRKILVVDGALGFTGGVNIREGHSHHYHPKHYICDMHFRLEGPVARQLQEVFVDDWEFCTGKSLEGPQWFPELEPCGTMLARGISSGPDADHDKLRLTLLAALSCAESSVYIITPYFLPDAALVTALDIAALRGVQVDIILPAENNLSMVKWASTAMLWQVLERGCRVWLSPPPFDHTKLMVIDGLWTLFGSANWDPRSLRLNFEFDVESYDPGLVGQLEQYALKKRLAARQVSLEDVDARSLPARLRDGVARLLSPYL